MRILHIGCGTQYLQDAVNIDIQGLYASEFPEETLRNTVTWDRYYPEEHKSAMQTARSKFVIVDILDDARTLETQLDNSADRIIAIQSFEHIPIPYAQSTLKRWYDILKSGGDLIFSVPDLDQTIVCIQNAKTTDEKDFYIRHLFGSGKDAYAHHYTGYTVEKLTGMLFSAGFNTVEDYPSIHDYPVIMLRAIK